MQPSKPQQPQQVTHQQLHYNCAHHCDNKIYNMSSYPHQTMTNPCPHLYQEATQIALMSRKQLQLQQQKQLQLQQQLQQQQYIQQQKEKEKGLCGCGPQKQYQQVVQDYLPCHPNSAFQPVPPSSHHTLIPLPSSLSKHHPISSSSPYNHQSIPLLPHHQHNKSCSYYECAQMTYNKCCSEHHNLQQNNLQHLNKQQHNNIYNTAKAHYQHYQPNHEHQQIKQKFQQQHNLQHYSSAQQQSLLQQQQQQQLLNQMRQKNPQAQHKVYCSCQEKSSKHQLQNQLSLQNTQHYQHLMQQQQQQQVIYPYFNHHHQQMYQMRSEAGDKIKQSRDQWDYELSQDLQAKKLEMLKRKYGGEARAGRAAKVIQQAYRRYSLDKNFAKLRLEVDRSRLSRRFNEAGRSKTIWTEAFQNINAFCEYPQGDRRQGCDGRLGENYAVRVSQKALSITTTISEQTIVPHDGQSFPLPSQVCARGEADVFMSKDAVKDAKGLMGIPENNPSSTNHNFYQPTCHNPNYYHDSSQECNAYDNNAEFDCDMVAELPSFDETADDEIEHSYVYSDLGSDGSNKTDETVGNQENNPSLLPQQQQIWTGKEVAQQAAVYGSLKKADGDLHDRKMYNSPVWKRKMEGEGVMFREVEQHLVARKAPNHSFTPPSQAIYSTPPSHHHHRPDVAQHASNTKGNRPRISNDKQRKRTYRIGLNLFNKKPEKGVCYLIERNFLDNRPSAVARFLIARKGLSKQMIGEYLGNLQKQFNMEVLRCFAEEIDLSGLYIDEALRKFQSFFRMPGEAQKIERLMEAFASQYCHWNAEVIKSFNRADVVFLLAFAAIMLNTDLHNKSIKPDRKMKLEDFIKNLRGIDDGEDVKTDILTTMYERIQEVEFVPGTDHVSQVAKVEQMIVGKKPQLAELHRRLVCYCRLYEVADPSKKEKLGLHQREVFLFNDMIMVTKIIGRKRASIQYSFRCTFSLSGMVVYLFESQHYKYGIKLTNNNGKASIMLNARNEHDRTKFVEDLKEAILEMNEMEALRIEEELMKQQLMKHCNYNRHSKDSGVVDIELIRPSDFSGHRLSTTTANEAPARVSSSPSLPDVVEYVHRGSAGSLDSGLVSMHT